MKSLIESLFDSDLASKETGKEYLYGLVKNARVNCVYFGDYFDEHKIHRDFNKLSKKFKMQDWSDNKWTSLAYWQRMESEELLRELLYIIVTEIKSTAVENVTELQHEIEDVVGKYIEDAKNRIHVSVESYKDETNAYIYFKKHAHSNLVGIDARITFTVDNSF